MWHPIAKTWADEPIEYALAASVPEACELIASHPARVPHMLLIAADTSGLTVDEISTLIDAALDTLMAYVCTWGPGCERVHDIFDEILCWREVTGVPMSPFIMTTWHAKESLDQAMFFALRCAQPSDEWKVRTLERRLLVIGDASTPQAMIQAVRQVIDP